MTKHIEFLTIDGKILRHPKLKNDYPMKLILGYVFFRLNLEKTEWTFSQADIRKQLDIPQTIVNRRCKELLRIGIFNAGNSVKCHGGEFIPMTVNQEKLTEFLSTTETETMSAMTKAMSATDGAVSAMTKAMSAMTWAMSATDSTIKIYNKEKEEGLKIKNENKEALGENPESSLNMKLLSLSDNKSVIETDITNLDRDFSDGKISEAFYKTLKNNLLKSFTGNGPTRIQRGKTNSSYQFNTS
jgi:hypothetical protein